MGGGGGGGGGMGSRMNKTGAERLSKKSNNSSFDKNNFSKRLIILYFIQSLWCNEAS